MDSATDIIKTDISGKDQTSSTFPRRRKRLIIITFFLILLLALIITTGTLIRIIIHNHTSEPIHLVLVSSHPPALEAFCSVANNTFSCLISLHLHFDPFSKLNPNDIFTISLQRSVEKLGILIQSELVYSNCSSSLADSLSQLNGALGITQVNPFVERLSNDQRDEMMNRIVGAEENLKFCLRDLEESNSTGVDEVRERVHEVKLYVSNSKEFLRRNDEVFEKFRVDTADKSKHRDFVVNFDNMFDICMVGSQLVFVLFLFLALFRIR